MDEPVHAMLHSGIQVAGKPGFDFSAQGGNACLGRLAAVRHALFQTVNPVPESTDTHGDAEHIIAHLLDLCAKVMPGRDGGTGDRMMRGGRQMQRD